MKANYGERMAKIETKLDYLTEKTNDTNSKLDEFINAADNRYATKNELRSMENSLNTNENRVWKIGMEVARIGATVVIIFALMKFV
jgi:hypothetical protein